MKTDEVFDFNRDGERSTVKEGRLRISLDTLIIVLVARGAEAIRAGEQGGASERRIGGADFTGAWFRVT